MRLLLKHAHERGQRHRADRERELGGEPIELVEDAQPVLCGLQTTFEPARSKPAAARGPATRDEPVVAVVGDGDIVRRRPLAKRAA